VKLPDYEMEMSKHVGMWIAKRDTVVICTSVILIVHLLMIKIK